MPSRRELAEGAEIKKKKNDEGSHVRNCHPQLDMEEVEQAMLLGDKL